MEGIAPGMGVADARALDPALLIEEADFIADAAALAKLAAMVRPLQPLGHVPVAADGILLDVTGCAHLFGDEAGLARQAGRAAGAARHRSARRHCRYARRRLGSVAFRQGARSPCVPRGGASRRWPICRWRRCGSSPRPSRCWSGWDCSASASFIRCRASRSTARCGDSVALRLDQALGLAAEPLSPLPPASLLWSRRSCPEPIATAEAIAAALRELLQHLTRRLGEEGLGARRLSLAALSHRWPDRAYRDRHGIPVARHAPSLALVRGEAGRRSILGSASRIWC